MSRSNEGVSAEVGRMGLTDLAETAGVSVRTVRYYIAEGLLPPPEGAGPRAAYTRDHLDRLRLIARLKEAYLPLREIRRRLRGLDARAVRALLHEEALPPGDAPPSAAREDDSAAAYLARLLPPRPAQERRFLAAPAPVSPPPGRVGLLAGRPEDDDVAEREADPDPAVDLTRADLDRGATLAALASREEPPSAAAESWRRVALGPDAELLVRAEVYERQREQIESLVAWARAVLG